MQIDSVICFKFCRVIYFIAAITLLLLLLHSTTGTIYYVTPNDDKNDNYSTLDNNSVYILQHFVDNVDEYFTSNTQLYLLPGKHNLNSDIIIQDVYNVSIIGTNTNGVIDSIINCTSLAGIAVVNCSYVLLANIRMIGCSSDLDRWLTDALGSDEMVSLFVLNSWFVSVTNMHLTHVQDHKMSPACSIWALNLLGESTLSNIKVNCLEIIYDDLDNISDLTNKLHIENNQFDKYDSYQITIYLFNALFNVTVFLINSSFSNIQALAMICDGYLGRSLIIVHNCSFAMMNTDKIIDGMVWLSYDSCINRFSNISSEVKFNKCHFTNIASKEQGKLMDISLTFSHQLPGLAFGQTRLLLLLSVYLKTFTTCRLCQ